MEEVSHIYHFLENALATSVFTQGFSGLVFAVLSRFEFKFSIIPKFCI